MRHWIHIQMSHPASFQYLGAPAVPWLPSKTSGHLTTSRSSTVASLCAVLAIKWSGAPLTALHPVNVYRSRVRICILNSYRFLSKAACCPLRNSNVLRKTWPLRALFAVHRLHSPYCQSTANSCCLFTTPPAEQSLNRGPEGQMRHFMAAKDSQSKLESIWL